MLILREAQHWQKDCLTAGVLFTREDFWIDTRYQYYRSIMTACANAVFADWINSPGELENIGITHSILYTSWLGMRVISLLLSPRYQLFSEATPRKIVGTDGTIKVLLPEYQVYKCFIILNNCAIQNSKLGPFLMDF